MDRLVRIWMVFQDMVRSSIGISLDFVQDKLGFLKGHGLKMGYVKEYRI